MLTPHLTCPGAEPPLLRLRPQCGSERLAPDSQPSRSPRTRGHEDRGERTEERGERREGRGERREDAGRRSGPGAF